MPCSYSNQNYMNISLTKKNKIKIIITDSGLGGLSVHALLDKHLRSLQSNHHVELVFFNALVSHDLGYNTMKSTKQKLKVFNNAIKGMLKLEPDIILIACNTLSVLYPLTEISKEITIPVISIIDLGIQMILENISDVSESQVIIFGTGTTIKSGVYEQQLLKHSFTENQIISQACENLESEIQIDPKSKEVYKLIEKCVNESFRKINRGTKEVIVVLACTHYGYSKSIFEEKLSERFGKKIKLLNPNEKMGKIVEVENLRNESRSIKITNKVISRVDVSPTEMQNLNLLLAKDSKAVVTALENYILDKNLFKEYFEE